MRILVVSILLVLTLLGSYYVWEINHPPAVGAWDLVTEEAVVVYERNPKSTIDDAEFLLTSLVPDSLRKSVRNAKELLISLHVIGKEEVGTVLYLPGFLSTKKDLVSLNRPAVERNFEGYAIIEVPLKNNKVVSIVRIDHVLVMSST